MKSNIETSRARLPLVARVASAVVVVFMLVAANARASERWATLEAIHQLENPNNTAAPGALGELGPYQFRESTWRHYTTAPFSQALDRRVSDAVAVKHYNWLKDELQKRGVAPTPYAIALAWNGGMRAALSDNPPAAAADYAERAANLAAEFEKSKVAAR